MSHAVCVSDAAFEMLMKLAQEQGQSPDAFVERLIEAADRFSFGPAYYKGQHYYELDDWLRHLGVSDDEIADADTELEAEAASDADA
ncbi:MAG TPA: hypothetical protein VF120_14215 [Ktedonobacterales bacterium]